MTYDWPLIFGWSMFLIGFGLMVGFVLWESWKDWKIRPDRFTQKKDEIVEAFKAEAERVGSKLMPDPTIDPETLESFTKAMQDFHQSVQDAADAMVKAFEPIAAQLRETLLELAPMLEALHRDMYYRHLLETGWPDFAAWPLSRWLPLRYIPEVGNHLLREADGGPVIDDKPLDRMRCGDILEKVLMRYPLSLSDVWPWCFGIVESSKTYNEFAIRAEMFCKVYDLESRSSGGSWDKAYWAKALATEPLDGPFILGSGLLKGIDNASG